MDDRGPTKSAHRDIPSRAAGSGRGSRLFVVAFGYVPGLAAVLFGLWASGGTRVTCTRGDAVACTVETRAWLGLVVEGTREVRRPQRAVAETERRDVRERDAASGRLRTVAQTRHAVYLLTRGGKDLLGRTYTESGARRAADRLDAVLVRDVPGTATVVLFDLLALPAVLGGIGWALFVAKLAGSNARILAGIEARERSSSG